MKAISREDLILSHNSNYKFEINYPGDDKMKEVLENLKEQLQNYKENHIDYDYKILLSSGEEVNFTFVKKNLAHLFGVDSQAIKDTDYLQKQLKIERLHSFKILELLTEDPTCAIAFNKKYDGKLLNPYRIKARTEAMRNISEIQDMNFFVINHDKEISTTTSALNSNKIIVRKHEGRNYDYSMLTIVDKEELKYLESIFLSSTKDYKFKKQKVAIPIEMSISRDPIITLRQQNKTLKSRLIELRNDLDEHDASIDVTDLVIKLLEDEQKRGKRK